MDENNSVVPLRDGEYLGSNLPVTQGDFDALSNQRKMLLEFTHKQLRKDVDYGVIPGTPRSSLLKPGAEKLKLLFGLGVRLIQTDKTIDKSQNFAMFTYKAEVYHLKSGQVIAECEASCNSQEKKYKERTAWVDNKKQKEITPIYDILNTLQKMAQKRAMVGGVILAVGASDFFTQDLDDIDDAGSVGAIVAQPKDVTSSVPKVTKVTSEPHIVHGEEKPETPLVEALTSFDQKDIAKAAGFRWDKDGKRWTKFASAEECLAFPFETRVIA